MKISLARSFALALAAFAGPTQAANFVVTSNGDSGAGSLRDAIVQANATAGADTISFNLTGTAEHVIGLQTLLPALTESVTIDGASQPTSITGPNVRLSGAAVSMMAGDALLRLEAGNCTISKIGLSGFGGALGACGIYATGLGQNTFADLKIGNYAWPNDQLGTGIKVESKNGVTCGGGAFSRTTVGGCWIGVDLVNVTGGTFSQMVIGKQTLTDAVPGNLYGVRVQGGSQISMSSLGNVNAFIHNGMALELDGTSNFSLFNANFVTSANASLAFTNPPPGSQTATILVKGASNGIVMDQAIVEGDKGTGVLVSDGCQNFRIQYSTFQGNLPRGLAVVGSAISNVTVKGCTFLGSNTVGLLASGTGSGITGLDVIQCEFGSSHVFTLPPFSGYPTSPVSWASAYPSVFSTGRTGGDGIVLEGPVAQAKIGHLPMPVAGGASSDANVIVFKQGSGIVVRDGVADVKIGRNYISNNVGLPVNLQPVGEGPGLATANDTGDADAGPNDLLNAPVLIGVQSTGSQIICDCTYDGLPSTDLTLDYYAVNTAGGPQFFFGSAPITTDGNGHASLLKVFSSSDVPADVQVVARLNNGKISEGSNKVTTVPAVTTGGKLRFAASTVNLFEGFVSGYPAQVVVERVEGTTGPMQATVVFSYGTATSADFPSGNPISGSAVVNFADGQTTAVVPLNFVNDGLEEGSEFFNLQLVVTEANLAINANVALASPSSEVVNLLDVGGAGVLQFSAPSFRVAERSGVSNVVVQRVGGSSGTLTAYLNWAPGTANGSDFFTGIPFLGGASVAIHFLDGETSKNVSLRISADGLTEADETFTITLSTILSNPNTGPETILGTIQSTLVTIVDAEDISDVHFDLTTYQATEGGAVPVIHVLRTANIDIPKSISVVVNTNAGKVAISNTTISFLAGESDKLVPLTVVDDSLVSGTVTVELEAQNYRGISATVPVKANLVITDNDLFNVSLGDASVTEGTASSTQVVTLPISFNVPCPTTFTMNVAVSGGTANSADVTLSSTTITVPVNATSSAVSFVLMRDGLAEANETLQVQLSLQPATPSYVNLLKATGTLTILDDDDVSNFSFALPAYAGSEAGTGSAVAIHVLRSGDTSTPRTVVVSAISNAADLVSPSKTVIFAAGETDKIATFQVLNDSLYEGTEIVSLQLNNESGSPASTPAVTQIEITDNDFITVRLGDLSVVEGTSSTNSTVSMPITLSGVTPVAISFDVSVVIGGTAGAEDASLVSGTVNIPAGSNSGAVLFSVVGDSISELNETMLIQISATSGLPSYVSLLDAEGLLTITNDDAAAFSVTGSSVNEGDTGSSVLSLTVSSPVASQSAMTVNYETVAGTATAGSDFIATSGTLTFAPGEKSKVVQIQIVGDTISEATESFTITLSNPVGGTLAGTGDFAISILDNDGRFVSFTSPSVSEGNSGFTNLTFTASMATATGSDVTFAWATTPDGSTASAGSDYTAASGTATIPAGQTGTTFNVQVVGDTLFEPTETVNIALSEFIGATNGSQTITGTIVNDEAPPAISVADTVVTRGEGAQFKAWFRITKSGGTNLSSSVSYATQDFGAVSGVDYTPTQGTITFAPNQTAQWVGIPVLAETSRTGPVKFNLVLGNPENSSITDSIGEATITHMEVTSFIPLGNHLFVIKFPSGFGQNYLIQSTSTLGSAWTPISSILVGSGFPITQVLYCEEKKCFFRVVATEGAPPSN